MKIYTWGRALLVLAALSCSSSFLPSIVWAQSLQEGQWWAKMVTPGGEIADATYEVKRLGDSFAATMIWPSGQTSINSIRLKGKSLTFLWDPGFEMECRLERYENGQYKGACRDPQGKLGPIVLSPPDREPHVKDFDLDKGLALWGTTPEEYASENFPERQKEERKPEKIAEPEVLQGKRIEVAGRNRYLVETGSGPVTVVLESGLGDDHHVWQAVQQSVSKITRVVSYDRAGLGLSDPADLPRTPDQIARELHELLQAASIPPPYVLVGHEAGALHVRRFASLFPDEVKGLVLVDPSHEELGARWEKLDAEAWSDYLRKKETFLASTSQTAHAEFQELTRLYEAGFLEGGDALPEVTVVVLSGVRPFETHRWIGETPKGLKAKQSVHATLATQFGGDHIVSEKSSSLIHLDEPELVVAAIRKVLGSVEK